MMLFASLPSVMMLMPIVLFVLYNLLFLFLNSYGGIKLVSAPTEGLVRDRLEPIGSVCISLTFMKPIFSPYIPLEIVVPIFWSLLASFIFGLLIGLSRRGLF